MARQGWGGSIATAAGVAAGAGAAQLGFGYGLGILNWAPTEATAGTAAWVASLIWATWIAATSTIFGAVCAQRLRDRRNGPHPVSGPAVAPPDADPPSVDTAPQSDTAGADTVRSDNDVRSPAAGSTDARREVGDGGGLWWIALAGAAGLGALITVLLVAVPARVAEVPDTPSPRNMAAGYAAIGVLVGVLVAVWALRCRAAATNVIATAGWLWLLAVVAVVDSVLAGRGLTTAQLGIWQLSSDNPQFWIRDYFYWPGAVLSLTSALLIGALAARHGVRPADRRVGATASGAAGPLLVAVAYFLAVPRLTAISPEQVSAHLIAPYAVIVGIGGSVLVAALAQRAARRRQDLPPTGEVPRVPRQRVAADDAHTAPAADEGAARTRTASDSTTADPTTPDPAGSGSTLDGPAADSAKESVRATPRSTSTARRRLGGRSGAVGDDAPVTPGGSPTSDGPSTPSTPDTTPSDGDTSDSAPEGTGRRNRRSR
ncbi:hypothetical protein ABZ738_17825 [Micromonospora sp. NPDC047793]|uniref:hypothetical protein n=1 Tax=unclassified Micromonospora TaxID=2617518 RepID=UPI0033C2150E